MKFVFLFSALLCVFGQQGCVFVQHGSGAQAGDGLNYPKSGDTVTMHYVGTLTNGQKFDSSRDRGTPFSTQIGVGKVIRGWDIGVPQLSLGESATLRITASCGYGATGAGSIPGGADLVFQVELLSINGKTATPQFTAAPAFSLAAANPFLPTCTPTNCGMGMTNVGSTTAVCLCHASCLNALSAMPCCQGFKEACPSLTPPPTAPPTFPPSAPAPLVSFAATPVGTLPECKPNQCGKAIGWDQNDLMARPVCMCNPICDMMKGTPGVLPCCPKIQEVCLDPWRSSPTAAPTFPRTIGISGVSFASQQATQLTPPPTARIVGISGVSISSQQFTQFTPPPTARVIGISGVSIASQQTTQLTPPPTLQLTRFPEIALPQQTLAPTSRAISVSTVSMVSQPLNTPAPTALVTPAPTALFTPVVDADTASSETSTEQEEPEQASSEEATDSYEYDATQAPTPSPTQSPTPAPTEAPTPAPTPETKKGKAKAGKNSKKPTKAAACGFGATQWTVQRTCPKQRFAIRGGKCAKLCNPVDSSAAVQFWEGTEEGERQCNAFVAKC